jgi:hypothetical protein
MEVLVSFMIIPLNAMAVRKYHAHRKISFSPLQYGPTPAAASAAIFSTVQVSWKKSPGNTLREIGETATVYENKVGITK